MSENPLQHWERKVFPAESGSIDALSALQEKALEGDDYESPDAVALAEAAQHVLRRDGYLKDTETDPEIVAEYSRLTEKAVRFYAEADPFKATEDCITITAGRLPAFTEEGRAPLLEKLDALEAETAAFLDRMASSGSVSLQHRMGVSNLIARLQTLRFKLENPYQTGCPGKHTSIVTENIISLLREGFDTDENTAEFLRLNCREIPRFLEDAQRLIQKQMDEGGPIYKVSVEAAKDDLAAARELIETAFKERLQAEGDASLMENAKEALDVLGAFLKDLPEGSLSDTRGFAVGRETLKGIYRYERGLGEVDPEDIIRMGESEVGALAPRVLELIGKLAERYGIDPHLKPGEFMTALRPYMHFAEDKKGLLRNVRTAFDLGNDFFTQGRDVPAAVCTIDISNAPSFLQRFGFMVVFPNMFDPDAEKPAAMYMIGVDALNVQENPMCSMEHLVEVGSHEVSPGHINQGQHMKQNPDVGMRTGGGLSSLSMIEGWALFSEEIAADAGFFEWAAEKLELDADIIRLFYLKMKLLRAGRMVVDPRLQMEEMTQDEAERYLVDHIWVDEGYAKGQVAFYPTLPGYPSSYHPGYLHLKATRDLAVQILDGVMNEKEARYWFYETFLNDCGFMPAHLVSRVVLIKAMQRKEAHQIR